MVDVGTASLTYDFTIDRAGERCVTMRVVTVLIDDERRKREWPDAHRKLLAEAGPQPPELLVVES